MHYTLISQLPHEQMELHRLEPVGAQERCPVSQAKCSAAEEKSLDARVRYFVAGEKHSMQSFRQRAKVAAQRQLLGVAYSNAALNPGLLELVQSECFCFLGELLRGCALLKTPAGSPVWQNMATDPLRCAGPANDLDILHTHT